MWSISFCKWLLNYTGTQPTSFHCSARVNAINQFQFYSTKFSNEWELFSNGKRCLHYDSYGYGAIKVIQSSDVCLYSNWRIKEVQDASPQIDRKKKTRWIPWLMCVNSALLVLVVGFMFLFSSIRMEAMHPTDLFPIKLPQPGCVRMWDWEMSVYIVDDRHKW